LFILIGRQPQKIVHLLEQIEDEDSLAGDGEGDEVDTFQENAVLRKNWDLKLQGVARKTTPIQSDVERKYFVTIATKYLRSTRQQPQPKYEGINHFEMAMDWNKAVCSAIVDDEEFIRTTVAERHKSNDQFLLDDISLKTEYHLKSYSKILDEQVERRLHFQNSDDRRNFDSFRQDLQQPTATPSAGTIIPILPVPNHVVEFEAVPTQQIPNAQGHNRRTNFEDVEIPQSEDPPIRMRTTAVACPECGTTLHKTTSNCHAGGYAKFRRKNTRGLDRVNKSATQAAYLEWQSMNDAQKTAWIGCHNDDQRNVFLES